MCGVFRTYLLVFSLAARALPGLCADNTRVEGVVRDSSGAVVAGATITVKTGAFSATARSDNEGKFSLANVPARSGMLDAAAAGFADAHQVWNSAESAQLQIEIVLQPSSVNQQVVVSAARTELRLSEAPGSTVLLSQSDLAASPALVVDDILRQVPGFSLFRRSDSRSANPGSQGLSLRGLGPSGASRALVLEDGIPLVDPFGGWVYWDRVPPVALASAEVFRGGISDLYGSDALGGVVQLVTRQPETLALTLESSYGNERTPYLSLWTGTRAGKWDLALATDLFRTDGYIPVPLLSADTGQPLRGTIDAPLNSEHAAVDFGVGHQLGTKGRMFARGSFYADSRDNGTRIQTNDTRIGQGAAGLDKQLGANDSVTVRLFGDVETFHQSFSAISSNRDSEALTDLQAVPSQQLGANGQWTHLFGKNDTLLAGADIQEVIGASDDQLFSAVSGAHTANTAAGGRQRIGGLFGEDIFRYHDRWTIILSARLDHWDNFDASSLRTPLLPSGPLQPTYFADRSDNAFNPRLSVLHALNSHVSVTGSIYRAFRAPTLNELYRNFRVGDVLTNGNPALTAEHLTGAEAGANVNGWNGKLDVRGTFFWSDIVDPVENVTLDATSSPILREKENLGRTRSRGVELDGVFHVSRDIQISAGYAYIDATVIQFPSDTALVGLDVPQVPRNQFTWEARYWNPARLLLSLQGRFIGQQFDDDQNQFPLAKFYAMDLLIRRNLNRHMEVFVAAENLTDERYQVARTPTLNIGPPILFRVGIRLDFPPSR